MTVAADGSQRYQRLGRRLQAASTEEKVLLALLLLLVVSSIPQRFCTYYYEYIPAEELQRELVTQCAGSTCLADGEPSLCPVPRTLPSPVLVNEAPATDAELSLLEAQMTRNCTPQYTVSVVVPYRDRPDQLRVFLRHMLPLLRSQHLNYTIYVIEQSDKRPFNRGKLLNVGFTEAGKASAAAARGCFVFHDVDLLPEDAGNVYACTRRPRHLSARVSSMRYHLPYSTISGGALALLADTFTAVNGYSNSYFGWGGEDDDFTMRLSGAGEKLLRPDPRVSRYTMLRHEKEMPSGDRMELLSYAPQRADTDGLSSLKYTVLKKEDRCIYTWIKVDL